MKNFRRQAGATLLELTMVVGIIAGIAIAAIAYFNTANDSNKINDEVKAVNSLTAAVRNMFNSQGSYTGLANTVILKSGAFPDRARVPGNTSLIKHAWANDGVDIAPATDVTANDSFTIEYKAVPERSCADFVSKTYRYYEKVTVGTTVIQDNTASATTKVVGNVGAITTACSNGTTGIDVIYQTR